MATQSTHNNHQNMRIAIINLTGGGMSGGYRKYLRNIIPRMARHDDVETILCATPDSIGVRDWFNPMPNVRFVDCKTFWFLFSRRDVELLRELGKFSPDVIFVPLERKFGFKSVPVVNMIQNMEPFVPNMKGDSWREVFKKFIQRKLTCSSVRRADHMIAVSGFVKDYFAAKLHVPENKVSLVYHGLTPPSNGSCIRPISVPLGWTGGFLFTSGSIRPARGLEDALDALSDLKARNHDMRLVIAGETVPCMRKYRDSIKRLLALRGLTDSVCWTGYISESEMAWCYQNCSAFIMTSRVESFGQIALEAMSYGCLCISAKNPCLPEIFSDAAVYYNPGEGKALSEQINIVFSWDEFKKRQTSQRALERASQFSWDLTADKTITVLAQTLKRSKNQEYYSL